MPYRNKQMLRDANGDLIPQYWDVAEGDFKPLTGSGGANDTRVTGSIVELGYISDGLGDLVEIAPGESYNLVGNYDVTDIKEVRGGCFVSNINDKVFIRIRYRSRRRNLYLSEETFDGTGTIIDFNSKIMTDMIFSIAIVNNSDNAISVLSAQVVGVR